MQYPVQLRVRGLHIDYFDHVNNCQYLEYLEEARWARYHDTFVGMMEKGYSWPIVNININFRKPAFLGDVLEVTAELVSFGNTSCILNQEVRRLPDRELLVDAKVTCVIVDNKTGKPVKIEGELLEAISSQRPVEGDHVGDPATAMA
ncbi:MAG: acyl-CoA thioesterase [Chlamydiia bacterium]|nr:acyl-CoA thioesterase [Chlamydiia bacterium]